MNTSVAELIHHYQLQPHPEGGYYKETYRSNEFIPHAALPKKFKDSRNCSTAIYFLLQQGDFSAFHRLQSDECWHFYAGETLNIHIIQPTGELETIKLGGKFIEGETFQFVVYAGCWFAAEPAENADFSFVGCTISPGFDYADFEMAKAEKLVSLYPQHEELIRKLTR